MSESLRVVDLFAGVGGIRLGFERAATRLGHTVSCGYACDIDRFARETYLARYPEDSAHLYEDIRTSKRQIPSRFDVLLAGFPCQPFSLAGVSKKNSLGRAHGFEDRDSGTLFQEIIDVLDSRWPAAFLLENVTHLLRHRGGDTFRVIEEKLSRVSEGAYEWRVKRVNSSPVVPQSRDRLYFVGYRRDVLEGILEGSGLDRDVVFGGGANHMDEADGSFWFPELVQTRRELRVLREILHDHRSRPTKTHDLPEQERIANGEYTLSDALWNYLQSYRKRHQGRGNGFGCSDLDPLEVTHTRTLSARYHKDGSEILIRQSGGRNPRRLTPRECARLMGFRDQEIDLSHVSRTQAYRQMGNSVVVPVIEQIAQRMLEGLMLLDAADRDPPSPEVGDEAA